MAEKDRESSDSISLSRTGWEKAEGKFSQRDNAATPPPPPPPPPITTSSYPSEDCGPRRND
jgi:hypothetical protein